MFKQLVVLSSLLAGTGAASMAMYLQANPLAFNSEPRVNLDTYLYSARTDAPPPPAEAAPSGADEPRVLHLPEVVVTRAERPPAVPVKPAAPTTDEPADAPAGPANALPGSAPRELHPCSDFRELGPVNVDDGVPSGVRGVRDLC